MSTIEDNFLIDLEFSGDIKSAPNGDIQLIRGLANLKQALFNCLVTVPGSLSHRPTYGVGVQKWQNNIGSIAKQQQLALEIKKQFENDDRVEKVNSISIKQDQSNPGLFVVSYKITAVGIGLIEDTLDPFGEVII